MKKDALHDFSIFSFVQLPHSNSLSGAEGFGKYTTGGRGGRVMIVTNLHDSRSEKSARGGRERRSAYRCFRRRREHPPSKHPCESKRRYYYCRSKRPGRWNLSYGLCFWSFDASSRHSYYLRVRVGDKFSTDTDGIGGGRYGQKNVILDHLSVTWSIDECLSIYKTENVTVQWCLVAHTASRAQAHERFARIRRHLGRSGKRHFTTICRANHSSRNPRSPRSKGTKSVDRIATT